LQAQHLTWLTPRRMKAVTIMLVVVAFAVSSVGISGSTPASAAHPGQGAVSATAAHR
jgi:hypothetical protein